MIRTYLNNQQTVWKTQAVDGTFRFFEKLPNKKVIRLKSSECQNVTEAAATKQAGVLVSTYKPASTQPPPQPPSNGRTSSSSSEGFEKSPSEIVAIRNILKICQAVRNHFEVLDMSCQLDPGIPVIGSGGFGIVLSAGTHRCVKLGDFGHGKKTSNRTTTLQNENNILKKFWRVNKKAARVIRRYGFLKIENQAANALILERTGVNLYDWCRAHNPSFKLRLHMCHEMLLAVQEVHLARIVHNDVNPRNFCVHDKKSVKMIDFGLAESCVFPAKEAKYKNSKVRAGLYANGTMPYLSNRALQGYRYYTYYDDVEALIYCFWYILYPDLFWWIRVAEYATKSMLDHTANVHQHEKTPRLIKALVIKCREFAQPPYEYNPRLYTELAALLAQASTSTTRHAVKQ